MKRLGNLFWNKFVIHVVRPLDPPYDSQYGGADVYFSVPFIIENQTTFNETANRLRVAITKRLQMGNLPTGTMDLHIETPTNSEFQIVEVCMRVIGEKAQRRWEFEQKVQEAFNA